MSIPIVYQDPKDCFATLKLNIYTPLISLINKEDLAETFTVTRTQRIHYLYKEDISYFCHISKNLWNQAHYIVYRYYKKYGYVPSYEELDAILNKKSYKGYKKDGKYFEEYDNYHKLGGATAQQILKVYIKAWFDYLKGIKEYWENPDKNYTGKPREPGYKKKDGEFILIFTNEQCKFKEYEETENVWMTFPKKIDGKPSKLRDLKILLGNTNDIDPYLLKRLMMGKFNQVRIIPKGTGYWIEIVYDQEVLKNAGEIHGLDKDNIETIDTGVENLSAITDNIGTQPIIIKSEIWKAQNQWYNKRSSELNGIYDRQKIGCLLKRDKKGRIRYLTNKTEGNTKKLRILTEK